MLLNLTPTLWATLTLLAIAYFTLSRIQQWLRLRHIPGPPLAGLSKIWLLRKAFSGRFHLVTVEVCQKYGSLARIGPNELVTDDADILRRMSAVRSPYVRGDWYLGGRLEPEYENLFSERDEERHNALRSKMALGYSGKDNKCLEKSIDDNMGNFIQLLDSRYVSTSKEYNPVDMAEKLSFLTLDVISEISFGEPFGNLKADSDISTYVESSEKMFSMVILLATWPEIGNVIFSKWFRPFMPHDTDTTGVGNLMRIAKQVVAERFGPDRKVKEDMLGSFVTHGLSQRDAQSEAILQIVAGSDTTSTAMRSTLLYIVTNPRVMDKLVEEMSKASISNPVTDAEARQLPYLQAVIKEGMRVFPPVTGSIEKRVPKGGDTLLGMDVPEGTNIGFSAFGVMRNEKIWGADAKLFRPERWFEGSAEDIKMKEQNVALCFGYGKYQCVGMNIAKIQLNKIFVQLFRNFEIEIVDPVIPWQNFSAGFFMTKDLQMRITRRVHRF